MKFKEGQRVKTKKIAKQWKHGGKMPDNAYGIIHTYSESDNTYLILIDYETHPYWYSEREIELITESLPLPKTKTKKQINFNY